MTSLTEKLSDIVGAVFEAEDLPKNLGQVVVSDRPDLAQFQCNGALAAAKQAKKNPREIAQAVLERLQNHDNDNGAGVFSRTCIAAVSSYDRR